MRDAQGNELSGATQAAAAACDDAVRAYALAYGDPAAIVDAARKETPQCAMAHIVKAWLLALSNDPAGVASARGSLDAIRQLAPNEREGAHLASLAHAVEGRWASAADVLDAHLERFPLDLMAHQCVMRLDGFLGRFHREAERAGRALSHWSRQTPGYGILYSFLGFGLEEAGEYARAEDVSREAAELEPYGYWPHHAVSHVLEMTGRPAEGLGWMAAREPLWATAKNTNRVHIHWHKALFHVELGQHAEALALYDGPILETLRPVGTSLCNGTALLWRLETLGCDAGERWGKLNALWGERANGAASVFNDIHAAMTALRTGDDRRFDALGNAMRRSAAAGGEAATAYACVGVPVTEGMAAFVRGRYAEAVGHLAPVRRELWRMGGSMAQRDLVEWTLTVAAARAGLREKALVLAGERLAGRPHSRPNRSFMEAAERLAA